MAVEEGQKAPTFSLQGDDGKVHELADHKGERVVLYFYPRDLTPGCTTEACDFRDNLARLKKAGAVVYGVSKDSIASHEKFREKHDLNFVLLSDDKLDVHKKYGAFGEKTMYGKKVEGVIRSTFLIDDEGKIAKAWRNVKVGGHVDKVLEALKELG
jgi:peroxiredoxin Q/BCP